MPRLHAVLLLLVSQALVLSLAQHKPPSGTSVIDALNAQIQSGFQMKPVKAGVFKGGKGVIMRTPDFFSGGSNTVVPGSFWVNDIWTPNALYPSFNPWCPHGNSDGFYDITWSKCEVSDEGPWKYATVAAVVGQGGMSQMFTNFNDIQGDKWGYGVFYAADANSADQRCRNFAEHQGFDCPGYWVPYNGAPVADNTRKGSGFWDPGNPYAGGGGGGTGCHFDKNQALIDQTDAWTTQNPPQNLVQDADCQCNYVFNDNWDHWVDNWIKNAKQKAGFEKRNWLHGGPQAPAWGLDIAMCWVNNPRDMINLQNSLWLRHNEWLNGEAPQWASATPNPPVYWGWNEVPVSKALVDDARNWDAIVIKLPPYMWHLSDLGANYAKQLEKDLESWKENGSLKPGYATASQRPGSYVVLARELEWKTACPGDASGHSAPCFYREFFCENWQTPQNWFQIKYIAPDTSNKDGCCYVSQNNLDLRASEGQAIV